MEFRLLGYLIENKNRVISKDELFENVWKDTFIDDGTLNVHIRRLREKIEVNPNSPSYIKTLREVIRLLLVNYLIKIKKSSQLHIIIQ